MSSAKSSPSGTHWLTVSDPDSVVRRLTGLQLLQPGELVTSISKAGEGNMNLVLRVITSQRRFILKQSRPWVEKYPSIAAPDERILSEQAFYETIVREPSCAALMPATLAAVPAERLLLLEDLGEAADCTRLYAGATTVELHGLLADLVPWLARMHRVPLTTADRDRLANRALRALNHAHIFEIPFASQPALDLDAITPGLETLAAPLRVDLELKRHIANMGARYLADGPCLLHGDFYPGSWLLTPDGVRVIDPEFCFAGCPEFDLGVLLAHVRFMQSAGTATSLMSIGELRSFYQPAESPDARPLQWPLVEQFAAIEILRRLFGIAQLPLPRTLPQKSALIASAVTTLHRAITDEATGERPA